MNNKPVTSRQLAAVLGVSQSMVSRAFTSNASIAPEMRKRIFAAADEMGYRPNAIAKSLSKSSSNICALIIGEMQNPFYPNIIEKLVKELSVNGFESLLFVVPTGEGIDSQLPILRQYNVGAVVIASATISSVLAGEWMRAGKKAILLNRTVPDTSVSMVCCDNFEAARQIVDHLYETGRRRIAFVAGPRDTSTTREREQGFLSRLNELRLPVAGIVDAKSYTYEEGFSSAAKVLKFSPDAIFFADDILAIGAMDALRHRHRVSIPDDVAVVGFDDIPMASWPSYDLTTVSQPVEQMVDYVVRLVAQDTESTAQRIRLPGKLHLRKSSAPKSKA